MKERTGYWILITSRGHWNKLQERGIWGFSDKDKKRLDTIESKDKALIYLTVDSGRNTSAIGGVIEFIGKPWEIEVKKNLFDMLYPYRIKIKVHKTIDPPLTFNQYIGKVSFVGSDKKWGGSLQGQPVKPILEKDFNFLMKEIEKVTK
jgi:predicted RNA-binding protein